MVGETCGMRRILVVMLSCGVVLIWRWLWRNWLFSDVVKELLVTISSANFTYYNSICKWISSVIDIYFCMHNHIISSLYTLALKASTSDFSTRLFVSASWNCWLVSINCLYSVAFSSVSFSTWEIKIQMGRKWLLLMLFSCYTSHKRSCFNWNSRLPRIFSQN
jgi:hypothetical protein